MQCRFFAIPALGSDTEATALNQCLATSRILSVEKQFVANGENSYWAVCVVTQAAEAKSEAHPRQRGIDYREVLSPEDFARYARLRDLRKELAAREGVPSYAVFTNEQIAAMVTGCVASLGDLRAINGIGASRVEKYGAAFLAALTGAPAAANGADHHEARPDIA